MAPSRELVAGKQRPSCCAAIIDAWNVSSGGWLPDHRESLEQINKSFCGSLPHEATAESVIGSPDRLYANDDRSLQPLNERVVAESE